MEKRPNNMRESKFSLRQFSILQRRACGLGVLLAIAALLVPSTATLAAATGQHRGTAIAIGGALSADNDAVWSRIVQAAGGPGARIAVFATASASPERVGGQTAQVLERHGARVELIPVAPRLPGTDWRALRDDPVQIERIARSTGVYFTGGAQELIVSTLQPDGQETPMLRAIREVFDRGGVVAGTSAGAAIMSSMMFRDAQDNHLILKGRWRAGAEYDRGLGFVGPDVFIDQHFIRRGRIGRMLPGMVRLGYQIGLGVEEDTAAVIHRGQVEVVGRSGVLLVDLRKATQNPDLGAFNIQGARLSLLDRGDRHDLLTGQTHPAAHKEGGALAWQQPGFKPYRPPAPYYLDILAPHAIVSAMSDLVDSPSAEVKGLAFQANPRVEDPAPELGFEYRLYRIPELRGWFGSLIGPETYTVLNVAVDVTPVKVHRPLHQPLNTPPNPALNPPVQPTRSSRPSAVNQEPAR
jgi:cyanophycinase